MTKKVIISGLLGTVVLIIWNILINGIFGFKSSIDMKQIPNERQVYAVLKENIVEPGRYTCNPEITPERRFAEGEPVFSVFYGGVGHEAAGGEMLSSLVVFLLAPVIAAWLLAQTSAKILSGYGRKVLFFSLIGLLFAIYHRLTNFGIGNYPLSDAIILAIHDVVLWTLMGLVVAWRMKPGEKAAIS